VGTKTAQDAANAIGVEVGQIVKSLVFSVDDALVLALVSGRNQLDTHALAAEHGHADSKVVRPDADAVRAGTGFVIGGIPPIGHSSPLATYIDEDLLTYDVVWAAAGTSTDNWAVDPHELARATGGKVCPIAKR
jgi:prolyl-tRNA editing enzyme YbaK/EbsC (Cys-tRNA(Pro) deacylase)